MQKLLLGHRLNSLPLLIFVPHSKERLSSKSPLITPQVKDQSMSKAPTRTQKFKRFFQSIEPVTPVCAQRRVLSPASSPSQEPLSKYTHQRLLGLCLHLIELFFFRTVGYHLKWIQSMTMVLMGECRHSLHYKHWRVIVHHHFQLSLLPRHLINPSRI